MSPQYRFAIFDLVCLVGGFCSVWVATDSFPLALGASLLCIYNKDGPST